MHLLKGFAYLFLFAAYTVHAVYLPLTVELKDNEPSGSYCGSVEGVAEAQITIDSPTTIDVKGTIMGSDVICDCETIKYDPVTKKATVPGLDDPNDCIGKVADEFGITSDSVEISYDVEEDEIKIDVGFGDVTLSKCPTWFHFIYSRIYIYNPPSITMGKDKPDVIIKRPRNWRPHNNVNTLRGPVFVEAIEVNDDDDDGTALHPHPHHHHHHHHCHMMAFLLVAVVMSIIALLRRRRRIIKAKASNRGESDDLGKPLISSTHLDYAYLAKA